MLGGTSEVKFKLFINFINDCDGRNVQTPALTNGGKSLVSSLQNRSSFTSVCGVTPQSNPAFRG
jgi:hypothetical protein